MADVPVAGEAVGRAERRHGVAGGARLRDGDAAPVQRRRGARPVRASCIPATSWSRAATATRDRELSPGPSVTDGLAPFPICLNLALIRSFRSSAGEVAPGPSPSVARCRLPSHAWPRRAWASRRLAARTSRRSLAAGDRDCKLEPAVRRGTLRLAGLGDAGRGGVAGAGTTAALPLPQYAIEPAQAMFRFGPAHRGRSPFALPATKPVDLVDRPDRRADRLVAGHRRATGRCWSARTTAGCTPSPATGRSSGSTRRATSSSARPPWRTTGRSTSAPTTTTFTRSTPGEREAALDLPGRRLPAARRDRARGQPLRRRRRPDRRPRRRHLHRRRRHLRHQPRRHAALALRHQRARRVGAGAAGRRHRGRRAARTTRSTPSRPTA